MERAQHARLPDAASVRRWLNRAFLLSILAYLVVVGYLLAEAVMGADKWAPYGVNVPLFIGSVIASEFIIAVTAAWIFREDAGIWPESVSQGWRTFRSGKVLSGARRMFAGAWDIPIVDLRLRTQGAIALGRVNRLAALAPLAYVLIASAGGAPWGLRAGALVDVGITLAVWVFMEAVMVRPEPRARAPGAARVVAAPQRDGAASGARTYYEVRRVVPDDVGRILELEQIKWREQAASEATVRRRLGLFPEGQHAVVRVAELGGVPVRRTLVAWSTIMIARQSDVQSFSSWDELTGNGRLDHHERDGDVIVGVNLTSATEGATYLLLGEILASIVEWGKNNLAGGSRLNGFAAFNRRRAAEGLPPFTADRYARLHEARGHRLNEQRIDAGLPPLDAAAYEREVRRLSGLAVDEPLAGATPDYVCSNLRSYLSIPGSKLVRVIPDYFEDAASENYGVVIEWPNPIPRPFRDVPWVKRFVASRIRRTVAREWEERALALRRAAAQRAQRVPAYLRRGADPDDVPVKDAAPLEGTGVEEEVGAGVGDGEEA